MDPLPHILAPLAGALAAGGAIGFEREYRARPAGLRTHMLVCLAACALMLAAVHQLDWMKATPLAAIRIDPVRMAHGVLTGVGFLCGGVIFQQGPSVHGLTTAASLWTTSAIGMLFGMGLWPLGATVAIIVLVLLSAARWLDRHMPQKNFAEVMVRSRRAAAIDEPELRALLRGFGLKGARLDERADQETFELSGPFSGRDALRLDDLSTALRADPRVIAFEIKPRKD